MEHDNENVSTKESHVEQVFFVQEKQEKQVFDDIIEVEYIDFGVLA